MLKARLFGRLAIELDGRPVPDIAGLRPRAVLAWLLLEPGPHSRAHVAARFWPEVLDTSARASLRNALSTVRSALDAAGAAHYLHADRATVGIDASLPREIDVERFGELAGIGNARSLERAFELAAAPLLSDLADDWVLEARDDYRDRLVDVALRLADEAEAAGDPAGAVLWTRRALTHARLRESVHRTLMRRLAAAGERAEALDAYARLSAIVAAEFGTPPSPETRALAEQLRAHEARTVLVEVAAPAAPADADAEFVGRADELGALAVAWERAAAGAGGVAIVCGHPGMGKSRLVTELGRHAAGTGGRVVCGAAIELEGAAPLAPWSDALHELVATTPPPPPDAAWPADLARVCHAVETTWRRTAAAPTAEPELERARLFEAIGAALAWCARDRPLLVVLEDAHLMDAASVALLAASARRAAAAPVLLAVTTRPGNERVRLAVSAMRRGGQLRADLELAPLADEDIAAIVDAVTPGIPGDERAAAIAAAGGTPLLAREAARAAAAGGNLSNGLGEWIRAPLARLAEPARRLVDLAAAAGRPLERGEAAQLVGAERLPEALHDAFREHLLDVRADRRIDFEHALVREACYAELPEARRAWMHGDLADLLLARSSRAVAELARHLLLAARDGEAVHYLAAAAADARRLGAVDETASFLREAIGLAVDNAIRAELWLLLADVESWRGDSAAYEDTFAQAIPLIERTGDRAALAAAHVARGRCLRTSLCYPDRALGAYERALEILDDAGLDAPELRALALAGAAWAEAISGDVARAHQRIAAVEGLPEVREDMALASELALNRSSALMREGRFDQGEEHSRHAAALAERAGRGDLRHLALTSGAAATAAQGNAATALELADEALAIRGLGAGQPMGSGVARAYALSRLGRHAEAREEGDRLTEVATRSGDADHEQTVAFDVGTIALAAGDGATATEALTAALENEGGRVPRALARLRLGEAMLCAGDVDGAAGQLTRLPFEPVGLTDVPDAFPHRLRRLQGLVAAARGEHETALRRLGQAEAGWRRLLGGRLSGDAFAANIVDLGRPPVAGLLEPGVELGRVLAERGLLLAQAGRHDEARAALTEARDLADELSFEGYRDTLERAAQPHATEV